MLKTHARLVLLGAASLVLTNAALADNDLASAYSAILRGDYDASRSTVAQLIERGERTPEVLRIQEWLESFGTVEKERAGVRKSTFEWSIEQAKASWGEGKTYLALSFARNAQRYSEDENALKNEAWVAELATKARAEAEEYRKQLKWPKVVAYYSLLNALHPDDEELKKLQKDAELHYRLEYVYKDQKAIKKRIEGVTRGLLERSLQLIDMHYYREPDFKEMAEGALERLITMSETPKLHDVFDGLANPALRTVFVASLKEAREHVRRSESYDRKRLFNLYRQVASDNKRTVELDERVLVMEFLDGAISKLDQFSNVIWPAEMKDFVKQVMGDFKGVGIQLNTDEYTGRLKVVTPLDNSPALRAGIRPDDLIIAVDGETTKGWTTDTAVENITGKEGTVVTLTIFRPATGEKIDFPLTRSEIRLKTIQGVNRLTGDRAADWNFMVNEDDGVAYIRLSGFTEQSAKELSNALGEAREQGMRALVLDLRFNPGGLLNVAIDTVSTFLESGEIVRTKGRRETPDLQTARGNAAYADTPLVVLVNSSSASASEILSGALQDHHRAIVLGERTYGKGSVQKVMQLRNGGNLRLTTALYYLPRGESPHKAPNAKKWGIDPDIEVSLLPKEIRKMLERRNERNIIHNEGDERPTEKLDKETLDKRLAALKEDEDEDDDEDDKPLLTAEDITLLGSDPHEASDIDPQLETALLLLRAKLASELDWPRVAANKVEQPDRKP